VAKAKAASLNLSGIAERAVATALAEHEREKLRAELKREDALYAAWLEKHGSFHDFVQAHLEAEERGEA